MAHVPFTGGGPIMNSMMGGHTLIAFLSLPSAAAYIKDGKVRALDGDDAESGRRSCRTCRRRARPAFPSSETAFFQGMLAPAGTPRRSSTSGTRIWSSVMKLPDVKQKLEASSYEVSPNDAGRVRRHSSRPKSTQWAKVIEEAKIKKVQ